MINIALFEDAPNDSKSVYNSLMKYQDENGLSFQINQYKDISEFNLGNIDFDLCFIDIANPLLDGLNLAKRIRDVNNKVIIILITSINNRILNGFNINALSLLVKPVNYNSFALKMNKALRVINNFIESENQTIDLNNNVNLSPSQIIYLEQINNELYFHTRNGECSIHDSLKEYENKLGASFNKCAENKLINYHYLNGIKSNYCYLINGEKIKIQKEFLNKFCNDYALFAGGDF